MSNLNCKCFKCGTKELNSYSAYINMDTYNKEWMCYRCEHESGYSNVLDDKYIKSNIFNIVFKEIEYNNPRILRKEIEGTYITLEMLDKEIIKRAKEYKENQIK